jgi:deoxyribodipyrimidine photolyase-related protein
MEQFITDCLPRFGDYQDAMKSDENFLFHALLSPYLNLGLLEAREVCEAALAAHDQGQAPLAAVEGFVRQVLGWREYVRGLYWLRMPDYANSNFLNAHRPLPDFFWTAETDLSCLREALQSTRRHAYAHHIQRLMVIGNFALLTGLAPAAVEEWYLMVYADAYEWVELPNTHGMALFADGGVMASKPYAASGAYINRMSNYCSGCRYDPKLKMGEGACPFNYLYWYFLHRNEAVLRKNPRMALALRNLDRMPVDRLPQRHARGRVTETGSAAGASAVLLRRGAVPLAKCAAEIRRILVSQPPGDAGDAHRRIEQVVARQCLTHVIENRLVGGVALFQAPDQRAC